MGVAEWCVLSDMPKEDEKCFRPEAERIMRMLSLEQLDARVETKQKVTLPLTQARSPSGWWGRTARVS
jgi:hypothetical protein